MHVISLYLVFYAYAAIFDVMCVKKIEATIRGLSLMAGEEGDCACVMARSGTCTGRGYDGGEKRAPYVVCYCRDLQRDETAG
jgi:hypothetical protein